MIYTSPFSSEGSHSFDASMSGAHRRSDIVEIKMKLTHFAGSVAIGTIDGVGDRRA